jgi:ADP-ribosylation factor GTPase-activating protein 1
MDAFKAAEIERMRLGGNAAWRRFFEEHEDTKMRGLAWDDATIAERYGGEVGEEWKERLSAKVEGREYVPGEKISNVQSKSASPAPSGTSSAAATNAPTRSGPRTNTPLSGTVAGGAGGSRTASPAPGGGGGGKIKVDVDYFAKLGERNAARPADLPPSQGGKYSGFGSSAPPRSQQQRGDQALPGLEDLQKDPVAALSKGFGWFTSTVTKTAKTVNEGFIQPTAKQVCLTYSPFRSVSSNHLYAKLDFFSN